MTEKTESKKEFIFGNQAVARGALEAGVGFAASYPGTPASEIAESMAQAAQKSDLYFEYSSNEKVALEAAAGAAFSGVKALVSMKHYGLNVAADSLLPLVYLACPLVVAVADDPGSWSSIQAEQDSRWYSRLGMIPTLEPSTPQEAKEMTKEAFELAWKYQTPILVRITTRISLSRGLVEFGALPKEIKAKGEFKKPKGGFKLSSQQTISLHQKTVDRVEKIKQEISESGRFNRAQKGEGSIGVIAGGVGYQYLQEALKELNLNLPVLKIGMSYPFPSQLASWFIQNLDQVLIVEELDPIIEQEINQIARGRLTVSGKNLLPRFGELKPEMVINALAKFTGQPQPALRESAQPKVANRIPFFCPGCPHRATFYAVREALGKDKVYGGDIGCYMLGAYPPYQLIDYVVSMGGGIGIGHGISQATNQKPVVFIGDSTFFHAGVPSLINLVHQQDDIMIVVMDNYYTAMTGQQPHPGTGFRASGKKSKEIKIEELARAAGADQVEVANVYNLKETVKTVKALYQKKGVSVLVAKGECRLALWKRMKKEGKELPKFEVKEERKELPKELKELGCPAIQKKAGKVWVDPSLCSGCSLCQQLAPEMIKPKITRPKRKEK